MRVGLSDKEIEYLGRCGSSAAKVSVKDLPVFAAKSMDGATDLAATMKIAKMAGIKLLAAGGVGGVHTVSAGAADIPAEIEELGRTPLLVVCSGCIEDQGRTLDYLERKGVTVIGFGAGRFPAFYTAESGTELEYRLDTAPEVAKAFRAKETLGIESGVLVLNPVPAGDAMGKSVIDRALGIAIPKADELGLKSRDRTPFLLALIKEMTGGMGLDAHIALLLSNARAAAQIGYLLSAVAEIDGAGTGGFDPAAVLRIRNDIAEEIGTSMARELDTFRGEFRAEIEEMLSAFEPASSEPESAVSGSRPAYTPSAALGRAPSYAPPEPEPEPRPVVYSEAPHPPTPSAIANFKPIGQMAEQREKELEENGDDQPTEYDPKKFGKNKEAAPLEAIPAEAPAEEPAGRELAAEEPEAPPAMRETAPEKKPARAKKPAAEAKPVPAEEPAGAAEPDFEQEHAPIAGPEPEEEQLSLEEPEPGEETPSDVELSEEAPAAEESGEETASDEEASSGEQTPSGSEEYETTEYNPAIYRKNRAEKEEEEVGTTAYDPEVYRRRSEERRRRLAEAAGEPLPNTEEITAEPDYVDCKGPLEFTGEHPWAWKCTRCGQVFQKHEIPHKRVRLPGE